ncbi:hypothetical protein [Streptomyces sp. NBC_01614]|uniref:hypothetical protein n=1 Tax=Streptomyces sp. NBC_01614 TaxID=2975897 RepID=UPI00386A30A8
MSACSWISRDPARAEAAFDAVAGAGRDAMAQLHRILGVLNDPQGNGGPGRLPQPGVADLPGPVGKVGEFTRVDAPWTTGCSSWPGCVRRGS